MGDDFLGAAVVDGEIRFFSPTSLDMGDPRSGGCALKWWYRYVRRIKGQDTASLEAGRKLHDELARYQRTGDRNLSALACSGLHMVPTGPDLIVEQPIHQVNGKDILSLLHADGVPVIGWVDHCNRRGVNMGGDDITDTQDPPGTVEIIDWKWKRDGSKAEYYLSRDQLITNTQLCGYGLGIGRFFNAPHVRIGHGYFPSMRGRPRKVTKLHVLQDYADHWKYVDGLARNLRCVAQESHPERVEGNRNACESYGGCPYRDQCPTYKQTSSADIFGTTASQEINMALTFGNQPAQPAAPTPDALAAEEARLRAQAAAQQVMPGFAEACMRIHQSGRGFPPLGGAAVQMAAAVGGQSVAPGTSWPGVGDLGRMPSPIMEPAHVIQLANEIAPQQPAAPTPPPAPAAPAPALTTPQAVTMAMFAPTATPGPQTNAPTAPPPWSPQAVQHVLPPDAPPSQPHLAAKPVEGYPFPNQATGGFSPAFTFPPAQQPQGPTGASPTAPVPVAPSSPSSGAIASPAASAPIPAPEPAKRGRKPKAAPPSADAVIASVEAGMAAAFASQYQVFVDCTPNCESESLHPYVDSIVAELVSRFCAPPCLPDLRCAPKDGPLGYGGWKGALRAIVMEKPPAAGTYHLRARGDEIVEEVAAAMLTVCNKSGGLYVR